MDIYGNYNFDDYNLNENTSDDVLIESDKQSDTESEFMIQGFTTYTEEKKRKIPITDKAAALVDPDNVEECDNDYEPCSWSYLKNFLETKKERKKRKKKAKKAKKKANKKSNKKQSKIKTEKAKSDKSRKNNRSPKNTELVVENAVLHTKLTNAQYNNRSLLQGIFIGAYLIAKDNSEREKIAGMKKLINGNDQMVMTDEDYMIDDGGNKNVI